MLTDSRRRASIESMEQPTMIGVAGGSGSGKTTVVDAIVGELGHDSVSVIAHDSYYYDRSDVPPQERLAINYDHPDALETGLLIRDLRRLRMGESVQVPVYDFTNHRRTDEVETVHPRKVVIVEGILILAHKELRDLFDIKIFVDADADLRLLRRIRRDVDQRGRDLDSVVEQYLGSVRPMHLEFVDPSKQHADIVIPRGGHNSVAIDMLVTKIRTLVQDDATATRRSR